jgi:hypothetical protein
LIHAAFSYPIMGRPRADPGEKHESRVAISRSAKNQYLHFVACPSDTTGSFVKAESGVCLLTQAAIEKLTFSACLSGVALRLKLADARTRIAGVARVAKLRREIGSVS